MSKYLHMLFNIGVLVLVALFLAGCFSEAAAYAYVWKDINCNGQSDAGEIAIQDVCVWSGDRTDAIVPYETYCAEEKNQTMWDGHWHNTSRWYRCCSDIYVFVQVPDGFQATTDTVVNDCVAYFGLAPTSDCPERSIMTPTDLAAKERRRWVVTSIAMGLGVVGVVFIFILIRHLHLGQGSKD